MKKWIPIVLLTVLLLTMMPIARPDAKAAAQDTAASDIRIMSANVLAEFPSWSGGTAPEATESRVLKLNKMLEENNPIAVGTQETSPGWYTAFELLDQNKWAWLTEPDAAGYSYYNFVPYKGLALNCILYRKDLLTLYTSGVEAYTQRSNGQCIVWGVFTVTATGKQFVLISTHWTPGADKSNERLAQAEQLAKKVNELRHIYGDTVICTGDFNCNDTSQEYRRFLYNSNSVDSRPGATTRGDHLNKIDHITATANGSFSYHTVCYEANGSYAISDHPFIVADIKLGTNLMFDFTDSTDSRAHYKQGAYRYNAFDYHGAYWRTDTNLATDLAINKSAGTLSFKVTAAGNPYFFTDTKSGSDPKTAYGLNFAPASATEAVIRFRMTSCAQIDTGKKPSVTLTALNRAQGKTASDKATYTLSQANSGYISLRIPLTKNGICSLSTVDSIQLTFDNIKNGSVDIDYIYMGVSTAEPRDQGLFFDYSNTSTDQSRYGGTSYGGYQFDKASGGYWATKETSTTSSSVYSDYSINNSTGILSVKVAQGLAYNNANGKYGPWLTTTKTYGTYPGATASSQHPLQYNPKNAEFVQVAFKLQNCALAAGSNPQVVVVYDYDTGNGTTARGDYTMIGDYTLSNGTYTIVTIPVSQQFKTASKITTFGMRFWHIKGTASDAAVEIDYIYVGPEAGLPTKHVLNHKVTKATCTAQGYTTHTCRTCSLSYVDTYTTATGHSYRYQITDSPTIVSAGVLTGTCSQCSGTTTVDMPKLNTTDYTKTVSVAATCTTNGTDKYTWNVTKYGTFAINTNSSPLGHNYTYSATTKPSTTATGVLTGTCSRCSGATTVTLPKLNDTDYTKTVTKAATCTAAGTDTYKWNTTNYGSFSFTATTPKLGHKYTGTVTTVPTLTTEGVMTFTCKNDSSHTYTESVAKLSKALYFTFDNGSEAKTRYNNYVYGFNNFDLISAWRGRTQSYKEGTATIDSSAGTLTVKPGVTGFTSIYADSVNLDLNYDPEYADYFQIRFKAKGFTGTTCKVGMYFYYSTDNSYVAGSSVVFDVETVQKGEYIIATGKLAERVRKLDEVNRVVIYLSGFDAATDQTGELTLDYVYAGPYEELPTAAYTVRFVDGAGSTLATQIVNKGENAVYTGTTPTKAYDSTNHYTFKGWDKALTNITANTTITATYTATAHSYTYAKVDNTNHKATCTCGYSKSEGHSYTYKATKDPTTSATGTLTGTCSKCSGTTTVTLPKLNTTDYTKTVAKAPTCTATGTDKYTWKTTTYGSFSFNATTAAKGHTEVIDKAVAATCTATGLTEGKHCSVCNTVLVKQETVAALGHSYTAKVTAPTCTAQGYTTHICTRCSDTYKDTYVNAKGHTEVIDKAVAATCTASGKTEGKHCSVCNAVLTAQESIPANGHSYVYTRINALAHMVTCQNCDFSQEGAH
ncbi:MAG: hypothetical protein IKM59_07885, partial [Oscillospiraceae bacterium]|nr:hypothetical protein [Oscillospiraceae bacterium]